MPLNAGSNILGLILVFVVINDFTTLHDKLSFTIKSITMLLFPQFSHSLSHSEWNEQLIEHNYPLILSQTDRKCVLFGLASSTHYCEVLHLPKSAWN